MYIHIFFPHLACLQRYFNKKLLSSGILQSTLFSAHECYYLEASTASEFSIITVHKIFAERITELVHVVEYWSQNHHHHHPAVSKIWN